MTVCVAALADKSQACVVAADREITVGMPLNIAFEHHERKIEVVSKACLVMTSGNALVSEDVVTRTRHGLASGSDELSHAATVVRDVYMQVHIERAEHVIIRPRGFTLQEFKDHGAQKIPLPIYQQIDQLLFNFTLNTDFIVAGVDKHGGHIYWVHYHGVAGAGWLESFDKLGYHAIGSGGSHAGILLSLVGQHRDLSIVETLYNVYLAKVNAEVAPGVGDATDLALITKDGIEFLDPSFLDKIEAFREKTLGNKPDVGQLVKLFESRKEKSK